MRIYGGAAVFAMLLTLLLIWFVSRAVVGPVRRLTAAAREMSQRQLPALVEQLRTGGDVSTIKPTKVTMIAAMLIAWAGGYMPLVGYIGVLAVISVVSIVPLREAAGIPLAQLEEEYAEADDDATFASVTVRGDQTA